jgi:RRXRR protein
MSNFALVLNPNKQPLDPIHPGTARRLLKAGEAAVYRLYPFTIIYKQEVNQTPTPIALKLDPGSKTTGIALIQNDKVVWAAELTHRGRNIQASLESRSAIRSNRRARKTRYRPARFLNRTRRKGWLAPSLQHRVDTTLTWVNKLIKFAPIGSIAQELVRFDLQQLVYFGFQTGDLVKAVVITGKFIGTWIGRISVRARPSFKLTAKQTLDVHPKNLITIHKNDGYSYAF